VPTWQTPSAISRLRELADPASTSTLDSDPTPQLLRISVRNRGCAGLAYHLSYLPLHSASKFDEIVEQDGVRVLIDSRALFSVVGSEMDWVEDRMSARFVFKK
jgi:iron-sulfur cluster assembly accessory protein